MPNKLASLLLVACYTLVFLPSLAATANDESAGPEGQPQSRGLAEVFAIVSKTSMPSLSGLIKPERMGLLTDNECTIKDNETHVLSDNDVDADLFSGNTASVLSHIHFFSGFSVNLQITINADDSKARGREEKRRGEKTSVRNRNGNKQRRSRSRDSAAGGGRR